jgi:hypothetical protein
MRRWAAVPIAIAVAVGAIVLVLLTDGGGLGARAHAATAGELAVELGLSPRILNFGDTLTATIDVTFDRSRIDPNSVRIRQSFLPWAPIVPPEQTRRDSPGTTLLRRTYVLRCLIGPCVPPRDTAQREFDPVKVSYRHTTDSARHIYEQRWPVLVVHSNIVLSDLDQREAITKPWKADLLSFPKVSYTVSPSVLRPLLLGLGALLALAGAVLAFLAVPRRRPYVEPEPEPEPLPVLSALEQALELLSTEVGSDGEADRRRALELVSEEMEARGELALARRARAMAWSEESPAVSENRGLADSVRALVVITEEPVEEEGEEVGVAPSP